MFQHQKLEVFDVPHEKQNVIKYFTEKFPHETKVIKRYFRAMQLIFWSIRRIPCDLSFFGLFFWPAKINRVSYRKSNDGLLFNSGIGPVFSLGNKRGRLSTFGILLGKNPYNGLLAIFVSD